MKVTLSFEMDEKTAKLFLTSALERVINSSIACIEKSNHDFASVNLEDWDEWKPICTTLWVALHDAVYRSKLGIEPSETVFELRKGDG